MLLQHGADPNLRNSEGKSALDVASEAGGGSAQRDAFGGAAQRGADVRDPLQSTRKW